MNRQPDAHASYAVAAGKLHWTAAILVGSLLVVVLGMYAFYQWSQAGVGAPVTALPAKPRLQADPAADIAFVRQLHARRLHSYQWIDRKAGIARIPIERAMALLVARGGAAPPAGVRRPAQGGHPEPESKQQKDQQGQQRRLTANQPPGAAEGVRAARGKAGADDSRAGGRR